VYSPARIKDKRNTQEIGGPAELSGQKEERDLSKANPFQSSGRALAKLPDKKSTLRNQRAFSQSSPRKVNPATIKSKGKVTQQKITKFRGGECNNHGTDYTYQQVGLGEGE